MKNRVFIGIGCDGKAQRQIGQLLKPIKSEWANIRWVPPANRHMTLVFCGEISSSVVEGLISDFDGAYERQARFGYRLEKLTRFPESDGRIIALTGGPDERLNGLYRATIGLTQKWRIRVRWETFLPHVTVARVHTRKPLVATLDQPANILMDIAKITLYRSRLSKAGSIYTPLKETPLGT
jgi:2'-5' RNA ligase